MIAANQAPDHATIARFRVRHESAIAELFSGVLELCAHAGLVERGVVMVDGTRMAASAADRQTRSYEQIAKESPLVASWRPCSRVRAFAVPRMLS